MAEATSTGRINKFDNLKGWAILLIVIGHLTLFRDLPAMSFIRSFVILFDVGVFFFVAGYFSKIGPDEPIKAFKRLFIPYIIFCIIWEIFNVYCMGGKPTHILFINPAYMLWFLMSLFFMKLALPIMDRFKYPVLISVIGALLIGFIDCNILGISRAFAFMPLFLLGFYYNDYKEKFTKKFPIVENNKFAVIIAVLSIFASIIIALNIPFDIIEMKHVYGNHYLMGMVIRAVVILVSTVNVLVLTRFMTNRKLIITQFGVYSLTVYLLHAYAITTAKAIAEPYLEGHYILAIAFVFIGSFIITYVLSREIVTKALNKLLNAVYIVIGLQ